MAISNLGIIGGALNSANEGRTVRQALTQEIVDVYAQISRLNNIYISGTDSAYVRLRHATAAPDYGAAFLALSELFGELAERHRHNTLAATLADCGVADDMGNLDEVLARVFGPDAAQARSNIEGAQAIWRAMAGALDPRSIDALSARFDPIAEAITLTASSVSPVAGV